MSQFLKFAAICVLLIFSLNILVNIGCILLKVSPEVTRKVVMFNSVVVSIYLSRYWVKK